MTVVEDQPMRDEDLLKAVNDEIDRRLLKFARAIDLGISHLMTISRGVANPEEYALGTIEEIRLVLQTGSQPVTKEK